MEPIKQAKLKRLICRLAFTLIGFILPIILVLIKFDIVNQKESKKITLIGLVILILIISTLWKFKKELWDWINSWEYSLFKYILIGFSRVYIFILILIITIIVRNDIINSFEEMTTGMNNVLFCMICFCVCQTITYLCIYPLEQKYDHQVKRLLRKAERIEDYNDAMNRRTP